MPEKEIENKNRERLKNIKNTGSVNERRKI